MTESWDRVADRLVELSERLEAAGVEYGPEGLELAARGLQIEAIAHIWSCLGGLAFAGFLVWLAVRVGRKTDWQCPDGWSFCAIATSIVAAIVMIASTVSLLIDTSWVAIINPEAALVMRLFL